MTDKCETAAECERLRAKCVEQATELVAAKDLASDATAMRDRYGRAYHDAWNDAAALRAERDGLREELLAAKGAVDCQCPECGKTLDAVYAAREKVRPWHMVCDCGHIQHRKQLPASPVRPRAIGDVIAEREKAPGPIVSADDGVKVERRPDGSLWASSDVAGKSVTTTEKEDA